MRGGPGRPATLLAPDLVDQASAEADCDSVSAAASLELRKQVTHVGLDCLFREMEMLPDLTVYETVGNELENLILARSRFLLESSWGGL